MIVNYQHGQANKSGIYKIWNILDDRILGLTVGHINLPREYYFISNEEVLFKLVKSVIHYLGPKAIYKNDKTENIKLSINGLIFYLAVVDINDYNIALKLT